MATQLQTLGGSLLTQYGLFTLPIDARVASYCTQLPATTFSEILLRSAYPSEQDVQHLYP